MEQHHNHDMVHAESNTLEYIKFASVIIFIAVSSLILFMNFGDRSIDELLRFFMATFMIVFASFKFVGYKMFAVMFAGYDIIAKRLKSYGYIFPFLQFGLGVIYLFNAFPGARNYFVLVFSGVAAIGVFREVFLNKSKIQCACLGNVIKLPLSTVSFVEDAGMFVMATFMLLAL